MEHMKTRCIILMLSFFLLHVADAQDKAPAFSFEATTHNFGTIEESNGPVSFQFDFTNTGSAPLIIQNVQPSCGCTTPDWTREPVLPGKAGFIKAEYNPRNRPGAFSKSLTITANTNPAITRLYIQGMVNPKPRTEADNYPVELGGIRLRTRSFNFSKITTEKPVTLDFDVYNGSDSMISFLDKIDAPDYIAVNIEPKSLASKTAGKIIVTYDPAKKKDLGYVSDFVNLYTNETNNSIKQFMVVATIEEYFPPMTAEELAKAPHLNFDKTSFDFGIIKMTEKVAATFTMTNTGKSVLNIRETKTNCGCTVVSLDHTNIKPGESVPIVVTFDPTGRRGVQQKSVSIFTNDPVNPTQMITIKANIPMEGSN